MKIQVINPENGNNFIINPIYGWLEVNREKRKSFTPLENWDSKLAPSSAVSVCDTRLSLIPLRTFSSFIQFSFQSYHISLLLRNIQLQSEHPSAAAWFSSVSLPPGCCQSLPSPLDQTLYIIQPFPIF